MDNDYARAFAVAVSREINAERQRQGMGGTYREFAREVGTTNHTSLTNKLKTDSAKWLPMTTEDLAIYCRVIGVEPAVIIRRAQVAADRAVLGERDAKGRAVAAATRRILAEDSEQAGEDVS